MIPVKLYNINIIDYKLESAKGDCLEDLKFLFFLPTMIPNQYIGYFSVDDKVIAKEVILDFDTYITEKGVLNNSRIIISSYSVPDNVNVVDKIIKNDLIVSDYFPEYVAPDYFVNNKAIDIYVAIYNDFNMLKDLNAKYSGLIGLNTALSYSNIMKR